MTTSGDVNITIVDGGGAVAVVPSERVQLVMGCSSSGTAAQIVATSNPNTLKDNLGYGPLVEAAALACLAGATVLAMKTTTATPGSATAVQFTGSGGSVITVSGTPYDDYFVEFLVVTGGTRGTAGITFQLSLDAGRNFGPVLALGTATTYAIPNTGITLNFAAGTLVAGDTAKFKCTAPAWDTAGVLACLQAFQASQYGAQGVGSMHLVGPCSGASASTLQTYLENLATGFIYNRLIVGARDAAAPAAWTGSSAESESTWIASLATDFSTVSARRICANGGHYNMPSAYANPVAGAPRYRRSLAFALAARQVRIPPQRHAGRVKDGSLAEIVIDAVNDPADSFVYHDERINSGLDAARFSSARTRVGLPGFYSVNPNLMSPAGSQFSMLPFGNVIDIASDIAHTTGQQEINDDVRITASGTIDENDALHIEAAVDEQLDAQMTAAFMVSDAWMTLDRNWNVRATNKIKGTISVIPRGYVLEFDIDIMFALPNQAGG